MEKKKRPRLASRRPPLGEAEGSRGLLNRGAQTKGETAAHQQPFASLPPEAEVGAERTKNPLLFLKAGFKPANLYKDPRVKELKADLMKKGLEVFTKVDDSNISPLVRHPWHSRFYGVWQHPNGLQVIRKKVDNLSVRRFAALENEGCCPVLMARDDQAFVYELDLTTFGYVPLHEAAYERGEMLSEELRSEIQRMARAAFGNKTPMENAFKHYHLHDRNILILLTKEGFVKDIKFIDYRRLAAVSPDVVSQTRGYFEDWDPKTSLGQSYINSFEGADFAGLDLYGISLSDGRFDWCNFAGAQLSYAYLMGGMFFGADFSGADLSNAHLTTGEFSYALFKNTDLSHARFINARLRNTNFNGAKMFQTCFDRSQGSIFERMGYQVKYEENCCYVTGPEDSCTPRKIPIRCTKIKRHPKGRVFMLEWLAAWMEKVFKKRSVDRPARLRIPASLQPWPAEDEEKLDRSLKAAGNDIQMLKDMKERATLIPDVFSEASAKYAKDLTEGEAEILKRLSKAFLHIMGILAIFSTRNRDDEEEILVEDILDEMRPLLESVFVDIKTLLKKNKNQTVRGELLGALGDMFDELNKIVQHLKPALSPNHERKDIAATWFIIISQAIEGVFVMFPLELFLKKRLAAQKLNTYGSMIQLVRNLTEILKEISYIRVDFEKKLKATAEAHLRMLRDFGLYGILILGKIRDRKKIYDEHQRKTASDLLKKTRQIAANCFDEEMPNDENVSNADADNKALYPMEFILLILGIFMIGDSFLMLFGVSFLRIKIIIGLQIFILLLVIYLSIKMSGSPLVLILPSAWLERSKKALDGLESDFDNFYEELTGYLDQMRDGEWREDPVAFKDKVLEFISRFNNALLKLVETKGICLAYKPIEKRCYRLGVLYKILKSHFNKLIFVSDYIRLEQEENFPDEGALEEQIGQWESPSDLQEKIQEKLELSTEILNRLDYRARKKLPFTREEKQQWRIRIAGRKIKNDQIALELYSEYGSDLRHVMKELMSSVKELGRDLQRDAAKAYVRQIIISMEKRVAKQKQEGGDLNDQSLDALCLPSTYRFWHAVWPNAPNKLIERILGPYLTPAECMAYVCPVRFAFWHYNENPQQESARILASRAIFAIFWSAFLFFGIFVFLPLPLSFGWVVVLSLLSAHIVAASFHSWWNKTHPDAILTLGTAGQGGCCSESGAGTSASFSVCRNAGGGDSGVKLTGTFRYMKIFCQKKEQGRQRFSVQTMLEEEWNLLESTKVFVKRRPFIRKIYISAAYRCCSALDIELEQDEQGHFYVKNIIVRKNAILEIFVRVEYIAYKQDLMGNGIAYYGREMEDKTWDVLPEFYAFSREIEIPPLGIFRIEIIPMPGPVIYAGQPRPFWPTAGRYFDPTVPVVPVMHVTMWHCLLREWLYRRAEEFRRLFWMKYFQYSLLRKRSVSHYYWLRSDFRAACSCSFKVFLREGMSFGHALERWMDAVGAEMDFFLKKGFFLGISD